MARDDKCYMVCLPSVALKNFIDCCKNVLLQNIADCLKCNNNIYNCTASKNTLHVVLSRKLGWVGGLFLQDCSGGDAAWTQVRLWAEACLYFQTCDLVLLKLP